jgi:hypothetical protein
MTLDVGSASVYQCMCCTATLASCIPGIQRLWSGVTNWLLFASAREYREYREYSNTANTGTENTENTETEGRQRTETVQRTETEKTEKIVQRQRSSVVREGPYRCCVVEGEPIGFSFLFSACEDTDIQRSPVRRSPIQ